MAEINQQLSRLLSARCELRLMYREASVSRSYRRSAPLRRLRSLYALWWRAVLSAARGSVVVVVGGGGKAARDAGKLRHETPPPPPPPPTRAGARPTTRTDHGTHGTCVDRPARAGAHAADLGHTELDVCHIHDVTSSRFDDRQSVCRRSRSVARGSLRCVSLQTNYSRRHGSRRRQLAPPQLRPSR